MARVIEIENGRLGYIEILRAVVNEGQLVGSRISDTLELFATTMVVHDPTDMLPIGTGRGVNRALAAVEAASLVGGVTLPDLLCAVAPNFKQFQDNGQFHGAYGPRVRDQYPHIERRLKESPDTRQAVATIWRPESDLPVDGLHDYPCTLTHAFYIRRGKLQMHVGMRSSDCWWGIPYDFLQFAQVQLTMANVLGIEPGPYFHHSVSLHLYQRDIEAAEALVDGKREITKPDFCPLGFTGNSWENAAMSARSILDGGDSSTPTELWYKKAINGKLAKVS